MIDQLSISSLSMYFVQYKRKRSFKEEDLKFQTYTVETIISYNI